MSGPPSAYCEAMTVRICELMVEGKTLTTIGRMKGMPTYQSIWRWRHAHPEFENAYQRAREDQADAHVEEMLTIARRSLSAKSPEEAQGYRLLVDTLKWRATKMKPKSYGDKLTLDGDLSVRTMTDAEINARIHYLVTETKRPVLKLVETLPLPAPAGSEE